MTGMFLPRLIMILSWLGVVGRAAYVYGYLNKGAGGRLFGAFFNLIPNYFTMIFVAGILLTGAVKNSGYFGLPNSLG